MRTKSENNALVYCIPGKLNHLHLYSSLQRQTSNSARKRIASINNKVSLRKVRSHPVSRNANTPPPPRSESDTGSLIGAARFTRQQPSELLSHQISMSLSTMKMAQTPPARIHSRSSSKSHFNQRLSSPANPLQAPPLQLAVGGPPSNQHTIDDLTVKLRQATIMKDHLDASVKGMREKVMQMEQKYLKAENINELRLQRLKDEIAGMKEAQANTKMQLREEEMKTTQNQLKMQNLANAKARAERLAVDARQEADELREQLKDLREEFALLNRKKAEK